MPARKPNRYELPFTSMVGAMLVVLLAVVAFVGWRALNRENPATPVKTVDYSGWLASGEQDGRLQMFRPEKLPTGWRATSANYRAGALPRWHLGVLTADGDYIGLEEALSAIEQQVREYVDEDADRGADVTVGGHTWQVWTDSGGDYALVRSLRAPRGDQPETLLVVGSAPPDQVRSYAASLR